MSILSLWGDAAHWKLKHCGKYVRYSAKCLFERCKTVYLETCVGNDFTLQISTLNQWEDTEEYLCQNLAMHLYGEKLAN